MSFAHGEIIVFGLMVKCRTRCVSKVTGHRWSVAFRATKLGDVLVGALKAQRAA